MNIMGGLFTLCVSFIALISCSYNKLERYLGCSSQLPRMFKAWSTLDQYMIKLDDELCSDSCPCYIDEYVKEEYQRYPFTKPYLDLWNITDINGNGKEIVSDCNNYLDITYEYNEFNSIFFGTNKLKYKKFKKYWKKIENKFNCAGFCNNAYINKKGQQVHIIKYLFSGLGRGVPQYFGCMNRIMVFLYRMVISYGVIALASGLIQILLIKFTIESLQYEKNDDESSISEQEKENAENLAPRTQNPDDQQ